MEWLVVVPVVGAFWKMGARLGELRDQVTRQELAIKELEARASQSPNPSSPNSTASVAGFVAQSVGLGAVIVTAAIVAKNLHTYNSLRGSTETVPSTTTSTPRRSIPPPNYTPRPVTECDAACVVCFEAARDAVLQPCGHFVTCWSCASQLSCCPMCRATMQSVVFAYHS